ncbi:Chorion peroxidase, partial [Stegodyphus mimosarum]
MLLMNFGLLLDHDVVRSDPAAGAILGCCSPDVLRHPLCLEIEIQDSDDFYAPLNVSCLNFIRDGPSIGNCPGLREQRNLMTSFIDGSAVYGPTLEETNGLRTFSGGKLRTSVIGNTPLLHINENSGKTCYTRNFPYKCFSSGDIRVNMHLELMTMHTIWSREHNRLADELQNLNPTWSDEKLFQEARRIAIAELQLITYREFLPVILGNEEMEKRNLQIKENETFDGYDESVDAGIYNVFSTAAFRFG